MKLATTNRIEIRCGATPAACNIDAALAAAWRAGSV
jgi:hypothetical protein